MESKMLTELIAGADTYIIERYYMWKPLAILNMV